MADTLNFTQDDAYISYRYVANYLNGDGLVYNIGERIEGFTNFGWIVFMLLAGALGLGFIVVSKIAGFVMGAGVIVVTYLTARLLFKGEGKAFALLPTYLVAANMSLAYWAPAGLETAAFALAAVLSLYLYLKRSYWLILSLTLAVWLRPEGALVAGLLIFVEAATERRVPWFALRCAATALVLSLPFVAFKLIYYGSILPNPFYAKTGFHMKQLASGLEYAGRFFTHYGLFGAAWLVCIGLYSKLNRRMQAVLIFAVIYTLYIVLAGGDVLKVHRFFIPLFGASAIFISVAVWFAVRRLRPKTAYLIVFLVALPLMAYTYISPRAFVFDYNSLENFFTRKMKFIAQRMKESDKSAFSAAVPTIGIFGYELIGHKVIDMVGLTDSTIARHSEPPIRGMQSTWKELKHNSAYLLNSDLDYIIFSTGIKPSAPAELALYLYPQFVNSYRMIGWYYQALPTRAGTVQNVFKKIKPISGDIKPIYPVEYIQAYKTGLDRYVSGDYTEAIRLLELAQELAPDECDAFIMYRRGNCHLLAGDWDTAFRIIDSSLALDSANYEAHRDMLYYALSKGDAEQVQLHQKWILALVPWYWPRIEEDIKQRFR